MELKHRLLIGLSTLIVTFAFIGSKLSKNIPDANAGVVYYVVNRATDHRRQEVKLGDGAQVQLNLDAPLFVLIHGYTESSFRKWIEAMVPALLEAQPSSTVLLVDYWNLLSFSRPLMDVNVDIIGQDVARMLDDWTNTYSIRMSNVHVIGFSLGGRIAGVMPHFLEARTKIGRITGIDPSFPWNGTKDTRHFLDSEDAELVVAIRTSSVGIETPPVHIDFYVNEGSVQPECKKWWYPRFAEQVCSHYKAPYMFINSLQEEKANFSSCKCQSSTLPPDPKECSCSLRNSFGMNTDKELKGIFHIQTTMDTK